MSDITPTRSVVIALKDERRTMHEGYAFLDEKCLLLAGAMLQEVRRFEKLRAELAELQKGALRALQLAAGRHGLQGVQCYPPADASPQHVHTHRKSLLGVALLEARLEGVANKAEPAPNPSPEAEAARVAFAKLLPKLVEMAAMIGNLERLYQEYRRTVRRVRALQDVLLPEIDATLYEVETRLEELEQDEGLWVRLKR
ncbi:MAG TPA: V-type ATP synthase subunit D [Burkholderiales bacterium]|jgi:V/A-type H+-transporting ATPase subunit D|nr:V-type ATP synthase subunit D [Burkholderiales bacterium]